MELYSAKVRLSGSLLNEVRRENLTAPEVIILRRLHGDDAVVEVKSTGVWEDVYGERTYRDDDGNKITEQVEFDPSEERARLDRLYGKGLANLDEEQKTSVVKMFGEDYVPLLEVLPEFKKKPAAAPGSRPTGRRKENDQLSAIA